MIAFGSTAFDPGVVGGMLKNRLKPRPSHSRVTPTQFPALFKYSMRIHGPFMLFIVVGLLVSSPTSGKPVAVQFFNPLSVYGFTQPNVPGVAQPKNSIAPEVKANEVAAAVGN